MSQAARSVEVSLRPILGKRNDLEWINWSFSGDKWGNIETGRPAGNRYNDLFCTWINAHKQRGNHLQGIIVPQWWLGEREYRKTLQARSARTVRRALKQCKDAGFIRVSEKRPGNEGVKIEFLQPLYDAVNRIHRPKPNLTVVTTKEEKKKEEESLSPEWAERLEALKAAGLASDYPTMSDKSLHRTSCLPPRSNKDLPTSNLDTYIYNMPDRAHTRASQATKKKNEEKDPILVSVMIGCQNLGFSRKKSNWIYRKVCIELSNLDNSEKLSVDWEYFQSRWNKLSKEERDGIVRLDILPRLIN